MGDGGRETPRGPYREERPAADRFRRGRRRAPTRPLACQKNRRAPSPSLAPAQGFPGFPPTAARPEDPNGRWNSVAAAGSIVHSMTRQPMILCAALALAVAFVAPARAEETGVEPTIEQKSRALLDQWKARFDAEGFSYAVSGPFVIAGDGGDRKIARYRDKTILAAARALKAMYFKARPDRPVLILLFESGRPYARLAKKWFKDDDVPYYGFFRRSDNVMLMNVGTGTGTLVHELVHALMAPDFPDVPDWFNEGLASLYEQCGIDGDEIR